jgi:hypothetical protein
MKDLHNSIKAVRALSPVSVSDNTAQVSQILDTANYNANELVILTGSLADADATFTVLLEEGDAANLSDAATVGSADLLGTAALASFVFSDDDKTKKIGYIGAKRYIRATITPASNASAALLAAVWLQAGARKSPVA